MTAYAHVAAGDETLASTTNYLIDCRVIARHVRTSTKATAGGNVEIGYMRLDGVALTSGHLYRIVARNLRWDSTVATDHCKFNMHIDTAGTATTSSTSVARSEGDPDVNTVPAIEYYRVPATNETASILLGFQRTGGSGTVTIQADDSGVVLLVEDLGNDPGDSGVNV